MSSRRSRPSSPVHFDGTAAQSRIGRAFGGASFTLAARAPLLLNGPVVAVLASAHGLAKKRSMVLRDLANERFVVPKRAWAPTYCDHVIVMCGGRASVQISCIRLETSSTRATVVDGVTCVPVRSTTVPVWMAWRSGNTNPLVKEFIALVRSSSAAIG